MRYRLFGQHTGLAVSELVLGTGLLGKTRGYGAEPADVQSILRSYVDAGGNFFDTSDAYLQGASEKILGEFLAPARVRPVARLR